MSIRSAVFAIALAATTCAQAADSLLQALVPHPLGVIITIGRWLTNSGERVYEVEVEGRGDTLDLARDNGHRLAVQQRFHPGLAGNAQLSQQCRPMVPGHDRAGTTQ